MNAPFKRHPVVAVLAVSALLSAGAAQAGGTITFGDDKYVSVGLGLRGSFSSVEDAAPNGSRSNDFSLDSARIYLGGSLNKYIKGMLNTEKDIAGQGFQVIDANVQIAVTPDITIWAGRFLSPSDRANMAGPYYSLGGGYWAGIASRYGFNGGYIGRDDGVAVVGSLMGGKFSYAVGAFEGNTAFKIAPSPATSTKSHRTGSDGLMYAARMQMDFWDPEPGYYGTGNYLGSKNILALGLAGRAQKNGAYSSTATGDYASYSVDFLMERKGVGPGALSLEAAAYKYDTGNVYLSEQGRAYSAGLGYIFDKKIGWGQVQPFARYQKFNADNNVDTKRYDFGVNYVIDGYNAQVAAVYSNKKTTSASDVDSFVVSMQFQF